MHRAPRLLRCAGYYFCGIHTMRHLLTCLALLPLAGALAGPTFAQAPTPLTLDQVMADPEWIGSGVEDAWWSWDGTHAYQLGSASGRERVWQYVESPGVASALK